MSATVECDYCQLPVRLGRRGARRAPPDEPIYCCYGCSFAARITQARGEAGRVTWMLTRLGAAIFLTMGVMVFSFYLYGQEIYAARGLEQSPLASSLAGLMRYLSLVFATPVFLILGLPIFSNAVKHVRVGVISVDALVVVGVGAAFVYSYVSTLTDRGATYYETACMILVLVTLGRWLEATGKLKASSSVKALEALVPAEVSIRRGDTTLTVRSEEVRVDDRLMVAAGQRIAADGIIELGQAHVDEQIITGESRPVVKTVAQQVRAGTLSLDGGLTVRATAVGSDSTVGRLRRLLEQARRSKGRFERVADKAAALFIPLTVFLSVVSGFLGFGRGGTDEAIMSALAVLLISCPCALGIATPMAIWGGFGRAAARGVLFRDGETMERLARVKAICFDKTGTLTTGSPAVASFVSRDADGSDPRRVLAAAAGLAATSTHALARSVIDFAKARGVSPAAVSATRTVPGRGVAGTCGETPVCLGSAAMMEERSLAFDQALTRESARALSGGQSITCVSWNDEVAGIFTFSETLRAEARAALNRLTQLGCRVSVLTGDHRRRGEAIAAELGVDTLAELLPEEKIRHLERTRRECGPVAMVGDGLNDAPALAAADVGIAMGCGADVTRESGGVCLMGDDLAALPGVVKLARKTVRLIKQNLVWAFAYNVVGIPLAMTGRLSPVFAAAAMVVSSLLVVGNSLRIGHDRSEAAS